MDGIIVKAIVIRSTDYNENDKLLSLYSLDKGKFSAVIKGVKKATAKLKFAGLIFCFGEYILSERNNRYIVTNCSQIESFYDICLDVEKYFSATVVLDILGILGLENESNPVLFITGLNSLRLICKEGYNSRIVLLKFLLESVEEAGFKLDFKVCTECGGQLTSNIGLDYEGSVLCSNCKQPNMVMPLPAVINVIKILNNTNFERLNTLKFNDNIIHSALRLLADYFRHNIQQIKSIDELLKI